jgi:Plasmid pRiA4b ORF-3-like protein
MTIAELHAIVQTVCRWNGEHLHRFCIHGTEHGIYSVSGPWPRDDTRAVRLSELGLRVGEKSSLFTLAGAAGAAAASGAAVGWPHWPTSQWEWMTDLDASELCSQ